MSDERSLAAVRWHSTNLVGVPAAVLAGTAFNAQPQALHIAGARACSGELFAQLERCASAEQARAAFAQHMKGAFSPGFPDTPGPASRWRPGYLKLLQGWGLDANGSAGAVLKGWVESRFGLLPSFHKAPLPDTAGPAWTLYLAERSASRHQANQILQQLDLLYTFCQWMLQRFQLLGPGPHATLWRGSTRCEEQLVSGSLRARRATLRLNSIVSFSGSAEQAGCFGDWVLQAQVPLVKLLLVPGLLNTRSLHGEAEVLALGGDYDVTLRYD